MTTTIVPAAETAAAPTRRQRKIAEDATTERMFKLAHEEHRLNLETWIRGIALMLVVLALVLYPLYALTAPSAGVRKHDKHEIKKLC